MKNSYFEQVLKQRLFPQPKEVSFQDGTCLIEEVVLVEVKTAENEEEFATLVDDLFQDYWSVSPLIKMSHSKTAEEFLEDQYEIVVSRKKITLVSHCSKGLQLALKTLRQLSEPVRGTEFLEGYTVQCCKISDYADSEFRAVRYSLFHYSKPGMVEKMIRLAAALKFNYFFLDCTGFFPFKSHPEFCWKDSVKRPAFFRSLLDVADDVGITIVPCFNIFHHASGDEYGVDRHVVLNFRKEYAPLFEPGGWSWCMSNPETHRVVADMVHELYEFFEQPDYFHIGKISSKEFRFCRSCAEKSADELLSQQIAELYQSFGEERPRFVLGKEKSSGKNKVSVSFPADILLELNEGDKVLKGVDCIQSIADADSVLSDDAGGTLFEMEDEIPAEFLAAAADIAWNGKRTSEYCTAAAVQVMLDVVADMEPVSHLDF